MRQPKSIKPEVLGVRAPRNQGTSELPRTFPCAAQVETHWTTQEEGTGKSPRFLPLGVVHSPAAWASPINLWDSAAPGPVQTHSVRLSFWTLCAAVNIKIEEYESIPQWPKFGSLSESLTELKKCLDFITNALCQSHYRWIQDCYFYPFYSENVKLTEMLYFTPCIYHPDSVIFKILLGLIHPISIHLPI